MFVIQVQLQSASNRRKKSFYVCLRTKNWIKFDKICNKIYRSYYPSGYLKSDPKTAIVRSSHNEHFSVTSFTNGPKVLSIWTVSQYFFRNFPLFFILLIMWSISSFTLTNYWTATCLGKLLFLHSRIRFAINLIKENFISSFFLSNTWIFFRKSRRAEHQTCSKRLQHMQWVSLYRTMLQLQDRKTCKNLAKTFMSSRVV